MRVLLLPWLVFLCGCGAERDEADPEARALQSALSYPDLAERLIGDSEVARRRAAAVELSRRTDLEPRVLQALGRALTDADRWVREAAAKALREQGPAAAAQVGPLTAALSDEDDYVRWRAAEALGRIGPAAGSARAELVRHAEDEGEAEVVRAASQKALERIGGAGAPK